jgi:hypothetical protein
MFLMVPDTQAHFLSTKNSCPSALISFTMPDSLLLLLIVCEGVRE